MKTLLLLTSILLLSLNNTLAQEQIEKRFELFGGIDYTYLARPTYDHFIINTTNEYQYQTRTKFIPNLELGANYRFSKFFGWTGNISTKNNGHKTRRLEIPGFFESFHSYNAQYLSLGSGLDFRSKPFLKRFDFETSLQLNYNFYLYKNSSEPEFESVNTFNWQNYLSVGGVIGGGYNFNNRMRLALGIKLETNVSEPTKVERPMDTINNDFLRLGFYSRILFGL